MMQGILTVKEKIFLTPHYIRVILEGPDVARFAEARVGDNNKIIVPDTPDSPIVLPEFGSGKGGRGGSQGGSRPTVRTYTMRALDLNQGLMTIDFVAHGEEGPASAWAFRAVPGSQLGVLMKVKERPLFLSSDWFCLVGDHTALPVISVILESLPEYAVGKVLLEVYGPEDVLELQKPEGMEIVWSYNNAPGAKATLPALLREVELPHEHTKFVFVAAEYHSVREIQEQLRTNDYLLREEWQTFSYWKYGQAEDDSSEERREMSKRMR